MQPATPLPAASCPVVRLRLVPTLAQTLAGGGVAPGQSVQTLGWRVDLWTVTRVGLPRTPNDAAASQAAHAGQTRTHARPRLHVSRPSVHVCTSCTLDTGSFATLARAGKESEYYSKQAQCIQYGLLGVFVPLFAIMYVGAQCRAPGPLQGSCVFCLRTHIHCVGVGAVWVQCVAILGSVP